MHPMVLEPIAFLSHHSSLRYHPSSSPYAQSPHSVGIIPLALLIYPHSCLVRPQLPERSHLQLEFAREKCDKLEKCEQTPDRREFSRDIDLSRPPVPVARDT